ncbi:IS3 family transposase (plasmid) [Streptomyces sp. NBC_01590]
MGRKSPYPEEFREDAVALCRAASGKRTYAAVAADLGITAESLRTWVRKDETQAAPEGRDGSVSVAEELARLRVENARLLKAEQEWQLEREILRRAASRLFRSGGEVSPRRWDFISESRADFGVKRICRVLGASRAGYYQHLATEQARAERRAEEKRTLSEIRAVHAVHAEHHGAYGAPRVHAELRARGRRINRKRVTRLMRINHIVGRHLRKKKRTTIADRTAPPAPDLVMRGTSHERSTGSSSPQTPRPMTRDQPEMPLDTHRGINALAESFFQGLKRELLHGRSWTSKAQTRLELFRWLSYYNRRRRHSALGYLTPAEFEQQPITSPTLSLVA